jgi:hypothetical protein
MSKTIKVIKEIHITTVDGSKYQAFINYLDGDTEGDTFNTFEDAAGFVRAKEEEMMDPKQAEDEIRDRQQEEVVKRTDEVLERAEQQGIPNPVPEPLEVTDGNKKDSDSKQ